MEFRVLKYFLAVAREGSITAAANTLHVTQPTLSRQLKDLEEELGKKLFIRSNYSVKLTDEGLVLKKRAEDIIDMVDKTDAEFKAMNEIIGGDIYIGAGQSDGLRFFAQIAKKIQQNYPLIRYHLYSGNSEPIKERLDKGLIDFGVFMETVDAAKYNYITLPSSDIWGVIMRKDHPLATKKFIKPEDLLDIPVICSRQAIATKLTAWFGATFEKINILATYDLLYNASVMVKEGMGCAIGFDKIVETGSDSELCFRQLSPHLKSNMYIAWKKHQVFSGASEVFLKQLRAEFGE